MDENTKAVYDNVKDYVNSITDGEPTEANLADATGKTISAILEFVPDDNKSTVASYVLAVSKLGFEAGYLSAREVLENMISKMVAGEDK